MKAMAVVGKEAVRTLSRDLGFPIQFGAREAFQGTPRPHSSPKKLPKLRGLLQVDPASRMSLQDALGHEWFHI